MRPFMRNVMSLTRVVLVFCSFCDVFEYSQDLMQKNRADERRIALALALGLRAERRFCLYTSGGRAG
jgi:hypothetical protein